MVKIYETDSLNRAAWSLFLDLEIWKLNRTEKLSPLFAYFVESEYYYKAENHLFLAEF